MNFRFFELALISIKLRLLRVALIQQQKIELASEIPEEPETSDPMAVRVLIKLPGGQVGDFSLHLVSPF